MCTLISRKCPAQGEKSKDDSGHGKKVKKVKLWIQTFAINNKLDIADDVQAEELLPVESNQVPSEWIKNQKTIPVNSYVVFIGSRQFPTREA